MSHSPFKNKFSLRLASLLILFSFVFSFLPPTAQGQTEPPKTRELIADERRLKDEKRLALVIGNAKYENVTELKNAANDAEDISVTLEELGFEVIKGINQNKRQMERLFQEYGQKLIRQNGIGLFFYAGHGVQYKNSNYLIPVDADIPGETDIPYEGVDIGRLLGKIEDANNELNIIIIDACRNNPFAQNWSKYRSSGEDSGVGKIEAPKGTIMIYATEPGKTASDGEGRNGLFTEALLTQIKKPGVELDKLYKDVGQIVSTKSNQKQRPYMERTNFSDFYFVRTPDKTNPAVTTTTTTTAKTTAPPVVKPPDAETPVTEKNEAMREAEAWNQAKDSINPENFRLFLKEFPNGANAAKARVRLEQLLWNSIKTTNDIKAVENFLKEFPNGSHNVAAQIKLNELKAQQTSTTAVVPPTAVPKEPEPNEVATKEKTPEETAPKEPETKSKETETKPEETKSEPKDAAREAVNETVNSAPKVVEKTRFVREGEGWEAIKNSTDAQPIRAFLAEFPDGLNAENAKIRLEKVVWDANSKTKDKAALEGQLKEFPNGANAPLAQLLLQQLEKEEKARSSEQTAATEESGKDPQKAGLPATRSGTRKINPAADRKIARWVNIAGMEFVFIEPGKFLMGASAENIRQTDAVARKDYADFELSQLNNEKPARLVTISQGFLMGKFEVTQEQWKAVMGANPSNFKDCAKCPVERVSWEMAKDFVRRLNELDDGYVYRLPSEAEWEYAARGGTTGIFSGPIDQMAWHGGNSEDKTHPVGEKQWNPFGLYDIYGNVSEWCEDIYSPTYEGLPADGSPNTTIGNEKRRVIRGGHWNSFPTKSRSNFRESHPARDYATHIGFRVVAVPK